MDLAHAFKEWAVICQALAEGKQGIILRKGGIAEEGGVFSADHTRFWLYPTYSHQQQGGIRAEAIPLLQQAEAARPAAGTVHLNVWAEVTGIYRVRDLTAALLLAHLHFWSDEAVRKKFGYREPGINALAVRVYRAPVLHVVRETAHYQGCKSWVELETPLSAESSVPALTDKDYADVKWNLDMLLNPTASA